MQTRRGQMSGASRQNREGQRVAPWMVSLSVLVYALWALAMGHMAQAAVFDIPVGDAAALITAINRANSNGEDDTINLAAGPYILTAVDNNTDGPNGLPSITSTITIKGTGADSTIVTRDPSADSGFRIIHVASSGRLIIEGVAITESLIGGFGEEAADGAGVRNSGTLTLTHSTVSGNVASVFGTARGGGIFNAGGTLTLTHSTVSGNTAEGASGTGGGIFNSSGTVTVMNSTISDNVAASQDGLSFGGGINNFSGTLTVINSTISGNVVEGFGDADQCSGGGGIANNGILTVRNSTIGNNIATDVFEGVGVGGGISGIASFGGVCVGGGISGTVELTQTIVAGNSATDETVADCFEISTSQGHNLVGAGTGCPSNGPDDLTVDPATVFTSVLGPLQNNGGPTLTHALLAGSPAIDAGNAGCADAGGTPLTTDQRDKPRPVDGNADGTPACDIGAVEFFPMVNDLVALAPGVRTTFDFEAVPGGLAGTFTITATFTNTSATLLRVPFFGVHALSGGNLLLNADGRVGGVGATLTPGVGDAILAPGEPVTVDFVIGLQTRAPFTFLVDLFGEPVP